MSVSRSVPRALLAVVAALAMMLGLITAAPRAAAAGADATATSTAAVPEGGAENGTRLMDGAALYPRVIRLAHSGRANGRIIASAVTFADGAGVGVGAVFQSTDRGRSFQRIGSITDPGATKGLCCSTLFELPRRVGKLPAGTLLWSASVGQDAGDSRRMTLPLWASRDHGRTWSKLAQVAVSPNFGGLWEPELTVSRDGRLVLFVSDESQQPTHSQVLAATTSRDGVHWGTLSNVVAADDPELRPGMPVVRRAPNGTYLMSYEICGGTQECRQFLRRSADGVHWGDQSALGSPLTTADGQYFEHAPTISWYPDGTPGGRWLTVGQMLYGSDGQVAKGSGATVLTNRTGGYGPWRSAAAPVRINNPYNNYCPNYSSSLLPMPERGALLEMATGYDSSGTCTTYFATGALPR